MFDSIIRVGEGNNQSLHPTGQHERKGSLHVPIISCTEEVYSSSQ
jgi:hypothetical protein